MVMFAAASPRQRAQARLLPEWHARIRRNQDQRLFIVTHVNHRRMEVTLTAAIGTERVVGLGPRRLAREFVEEAVV